MMCYRDMTFCEHWRDCAKVADCPRPLTDEVKAAAARWWGSFHTEGNPPIAVFTEQPPCHVKSED